MAHTGCPCGQDSCKAQTSTEEVRPATLLCTGYENSHQVKPNLVVDSFGKACRLCHLGLIPPSRKALDGWSEILILFFEAI